MAGSNRWVLYSRARPKIFEPGGTEAIFTLPNGMLAYIIADENGNIVEDSDILLDTNQKRRDAVNALGTGVL